MIKMVFSIVNLIENLQNHLMKLPLYLYALSMALIFIALPVILVWGIFALIFFLPFYFRAVVIWAVLLVMVALCAAIDYIRAS